ncbi:antiviral reverse transcriptase Drt3a [Devosia sp. A369]
MYDTSYRAESLRREVQRYDRRLHPALSDPAQLERAIYLACRVCEEGFEHAGFTTHIVKGKPVYQFSDFQYDIVLRKTNRNIRSATNVRQADRNTTIKRVTSLLSEGVPHKIYKMDIKSFYESIDIDGVSSLVHEDRRIGRQTSAIAHMFLRHCELSGVEGVPRGIGLSSTLAELTMQEFDAFAKRQPEVYFYSRYVDDILIITSGTEEQGEFISRLEIKLPSGLHLNPDKTDVIPLERRDAVKNPGKAGCFDFLGYHVEVSHPRDAIGNKIDRSVRLDLSDRKKNRTKSRLVKALLEHTHTLRFSDLEQRFQIITGNFNIVDYEKKLKRNVGIFCNYRQINIEKSQALPDLDRFIAGVLSGKAGRTSALVSASLTVEQRRKLLKYSLVKNFRDRRFYHLSGERIAELRKCWSYA